MISVITVCFNAEKCIEETIQSVLSQTYDGYEYIIVDGNSKDSTLAIIEKYKPLFDEKKVKLTVISESDRGIYDAMNKGARLASGDWIIYMNAGDTFFNDQVLSHVFSEKKHNCDVLYGNVLLKDGKYYKKCDLADVSTINFKMPFFHQGIFTRRDTLLQFGFDERYKISGDYDLFVRMYMADKKFCLLENIIAVYELNGVSETNPLAARLEDSEVRKRAGLVSRYWDGFILLYTFCYYLLRNLLKNFVPSFFYSKSRGWNTDIKYFE